MLVSKFNVTLLYVRPNQGQFEIGSWKHGTCPRNLDCFNVVLLSVPLYIQWDHFFIVQITLPTPFHWVPSKFMSVFKRLKLNLLDIVILLNLKVVFRDYPTRLETILTIFRSKFSKSNLK